MLTDINENLKYLCHSLIHKEDSEKLVCSYEELDEEKLYFGYDVAISDYIKIRQFNIGEIILYGTRKYYSMIHTLCSVGADMKWQLDDLGMDYTQVDDYDLFCQMLSRPFSKDDTHILFGDVLDLSQMKLMLDTKINEPVLIQQLDNGDIIQIDRYVYHAIVDTLRKIHHLKRNDEIPGNEATRLILIEDAREEYEDNKNKPYKSPLLPLISTMVNMPGFSRDDTTIRDMKIYPFMDSVTRIGKIKNADLLLQSGYSGFGVDLKKIDKNDVNYFGELK